MADGSSRGRRTCGQCFLVTTQSIFGRRAPCHFLPFIRPNKALGSKAPSNICDNAGPRPLYHIYRTASRLGRPHLPSLNTCPTFPHISTSSFSSSQPPWTSTTRLNRCLGYSSIGLTDRYRSKNRNENRSDKQSRLQRIVALFPAISSIHLIDLDTDSPQVRQSTAKISNNRDSELLFRVLHESQQGELALDHVIVKSSKYKTFT